MRAMDRVRLLLRSLFWRRSVDRDLEDEFLFHFDQLVEEDLAAGVAPAEARRRALRKMGGMSQLQEECRDMRRVNYVDDLLRDVRYAGRNLRRSPGFATLAVLIMALGIGANTAVFSVVNTVLLKPLSYRDPDRIVTLSNVLTTHQELATALQKQVSILDFQDWHDQSSSFEAMAYYASRESAVMPGSTAEYARVTSVSPEFFRVFAIEPIAGRHFTAEEMKRGSAGAVIVSYAYWQSNLAAILACWAGLSSDRGRLSACCRPVSAFPTTRIYGSRLTDRRNRAPGKTSWLSRGSSPASPSNRHKPS